MFANDSNDETDCDSSQNAPAWLDSVPVHTLPFSQSLVSKLTYGSIITARQLLDEQDRLDGLAAPSLIADSLLLVRTFAELGEETVRRMSTRSWDLVPQLPLAPPLVLSRISAAPSAAAEILALVSELSERDKMFSLSRLGFLGYPRPTLESLADRAGITRERVRQITTRFTDRVSKWQVRLPRCANLVKQLQTEGGIWHITEVPPELQHPLHALTDLSALGVQPQLFWATGLQAWLTNDGRTTVREYKKAIADRLPQINTYRNQWGAIPVALLTCTKGVSKELAAEIVLSSAVDWVIKDDLVVILNAKSTLARSAFKVIEAVGPIPITELQKGLERQDRFSAPKLHETRLILSKRRDLRILRGDVVAFVDTGDIQSTLTAAQRTAVEVIRNANGVVDNDGYLQAMEGAGFSTPLSSAILREPFVVRLERGVYGLVGDDVERWRVRQAKTARTARFWRSVIRFRRTDHHVQLHYRLTRPCIVSGELPLPPSLGVPRGRWIANFRDGTSSVLKITSGKIRGLKPWMRRANLSIHSCITVTIYEGKRIIRVCGTD